MAAVYGFSQQSRDDEWYQGRPINDIVFTGLRNISQSELEALINPYRGRIFDDYVFWEIQGKLYALEYFDRIDPSIEAAVGNEVIIRLAVVERPVVGRINFSGNSGLRRTELMDVIRTRVSDIFNQAKVRIDVEAIRNRYIEKGYPDVTVQPIETRGADSTITLTFNITEGEKISIRRIEFQGNTRFTANALRRQLSLKAKSLLNDGAFQEAKLLADIEAVTKYYHDRGFIEAVVRDVTRTYETDDKGSNMILTFLIDEGDIFTFGGVTFEGNIIFNSEQLGRLVQSRVGDTVNESRLETDLQRVADLYYENGYIFNSIIRIPEKNHETNVLSYTISIVERSRAYIEEIIIRGNDKTRTDVILREIPLEPGDVFSRTKVMDAMRNLYNLQFFSVIIPEPTQGSAENLMDLIFIVEEQPTTDVQFGVTFSGSTETTFPLSGMISFNDRNLLGTGNQLGLELTSSIVETTTFSVNYLHRWIFGLPLSGGIDFTANYASRLATMDNLSPTFRGDELYAYPDGFYSYQEYINNNKLPPRDYLMDYRQLYISLGFSTGYRWSTFLGILSLNGGIRTGIVMNAYDDLYRPFDPVLRERNNEWTPMNSFWTSLSLDQRDIFYDPSRGYFLYGRAGIYGIFDQELEQYTRTDLKAEYFLTLFNLPVTERWSFKSVLGLHTGLSLINKQAGRNLMIEDANKLAVDGMFTGRGWSNEFRNKGLLLWENWVELRFPAVPGILALDLFFDFAGVESTQGYYFGEGPPPDRKPNFTIENFRFSYGGGLRFTMPQFPIRLSLAKRFSFKDGKFAWEPGALFGNSSNPAMGVDLVVSFVLSY
jgi:outer membrane protein insertion porin family